MKYTLTIETDSKEELLKLLELKPNAIIEQKQNKYLKKINNEELVLDKLDGKDTLAEASDVFDYINDNFVNWNINKSSIATNEQLVDIYELSKDAKVSQIFGSFGKDLRKLCLTQAQIINFCKKYPQLISQSNYTTFFLFNVKDTFFVAYVYIKSNRLYVDICKFSDNYFWLSDFAHRVVVIKD